MNGGRLVRDRAVMPQARLHFFDPVGLKDVKAVEMPPPPGE
jgi:hypothetical protein